MNILSSTYKAFIMLFITVFLSGCADWNSVPVVVDDNFGDAVRHMVKSQKLNPDSIYADKPVLGLDGQKSEGNIKAYRSGSIDLRQGKTPVELDINEN